MPGHMKRSHRRKSRRRSRRTRKRRGGDQCMREAIRKCAEATNALGQAKEKARRASGEFAKKYTAGLVSAEKKAKEQVKKMQKGRTDILKEEGVMSVKDRMKAFQKKGGKRRRKSKRRRSRKKSRKSRRKSRKTKRRRKSKRRRSRRRRR